MERKLAEDLVDALMRHPQIIQPDYDLCVRVLLHTPGPVSLGEFSVPVARHSPWRSEGREEVGYLSLRYVLNNHAVSGSRPSFIERIVEAFSRPPFLPSHSSPALLSDICNNATLRAFMQSSSHPYSLLGTFTLFDYHDDEETQSTRYPFLVIPGVKTGALDYVVRWQETHARHPPVRA